MIFQMLTAVFLGLFLRIFFSQLLYFSSEWHAQCLALAPPGTHKILYQALICAHKSGSSSSLLLFKDLGMIHIFVVSGAHLLFLSRILTIISFNKINKSAKLTLLFLYLVICQFPLPAVRAWVFLLFRFLNKAFDLNTPLLFQILLSVICCLFIQNTVSLPNSLLLSWLACVALSSTTHSFTQSVVCFTLLYPVLMQWAAPPILSIILNCFLAPIIGGLLFPLSFFSFFIGHLSLVTDWIWRALLNFLQWLPTFSENRNDALQTTPNSLLWIYALTTHLLLSRLKKKRRSSI